MNKAEPFPADPGVADEADVERYLRQDRVHDDWDDAETEAMLDDVATEAMLDIAEMPGILASRQRADVVRTRQALFRVAAGYDDVNLPGAAALLDRVLREGCPHDPAGWVTAGASRPLTTCPACNVSWHADPA